MKFDPNKMRRTVTGRAKSAWKTYKRLLDELNNAAVPHKGDSNPMQPFIRCFVLFCSLPVRAVKWFVRK